MQGIFEGGTSLGDVYEGLANGHLRGAVAEFLADQTSDPSAWGLPSIQHAEGFEAYQVPATTLLMQTLLRTNHSATASAYCLFGLVWSCCTAPKMNIVPRVEQRMDGSV